MMNDGGRDVLMMMEVLLVPSSACTCEMARSVDMKSSLGRKMMLNSGSSSVR